MESLKQGRYSTIYFFFLLLDVDLKSYSKVYVEGVLGQIAILRSKRRKKDRTVKERFDSRKERHLGLLWMFSLGAVL